MRAVWAMAAAITRSSCSPAAACGLRFSSYTKVIISPSVHADTTSPGSSSITVCSVASIWGRVLGDVTQP